MNENDDLSGGVRPEASEAPGIPAPRDATERSEPLEPLVPDDADAPDDSHAPDARRPAFGTGASPDPAVAPVIATAAHDRVERPTIRWGALAWALIFAAVAGATLWVLVSEPRREALAVALATTQPAFVVLYAVVALGVVLALFGVVGLIRRGERARRAPRT